MQFLKEGGEKKMRLAGTFGGAALTELVPDALFQYTALRLSTFQKR